MYTGTLIRDLVATVDRVEQKVQLNQEATQKELHEIFSMQILIADSDRIYMGAA